MFCSIWPCALTLHLYSYFAFMKFKTITLSAEWWMKIRRTVGPAPLASLSFHPLWPRPLPSSNLCVGRSSGRRALPPSLRINTRRLPVPGMDDGYTQAWQYYIILSTSFCLPQVGEKRDGELSPTYARSFHLSHQRCRHASWLAG